MCLVSAVNVFCDLFVRELKSIELLEMISIKCSVNNVSFESEKT